MKRVFFSQKGPKAIGPYCSAAVCGDTVYLSGVIPADPETGALEQGDAGAQARRVLDNMAIVLGEMGLGMESVVKTTVYLTDLNDFSAVNAVYAERLGPDYPARSCVQVAALPKGAAVEIDAIASAQA